MPTKAQIYGRFADTAQDFCDLLVNFTPEQTVRLHQALAKLYAAGTCLPAVRGARYADLRTADLRKQRGVLCKRLKAGLPKDLYRVVFNPLDFKEEPVTGSLADGLADIWYDLIPGLLALQTSPDRPQDIWWGWKFGFETHWGKHAAEALHVLHEVLKTPETATLMLKG